MEDLKRDEKVNIVKHEKYKNSIHNEKHLRKENFCFLK